MKMLCALDAAQTDKLKGEWDWLIAAKIYLEIKESCCMLGMQKLMPTKLKLENGPI
jgi:hypothetical protein